MRNMGRRVVVGLAATAAGGCEFSAGVGDQQFQQNEVRSLARDAAAQVGPCVQGWLRQRDLTLAAVRGQGDRVAVNAAVTTADTACRGAASFFESARPPATLNDANDALMRTALANCRSAYADVAAQLALKGQIVRGGQGWSTPEHEAAIGRWAASVPTCNSAWAAAVAPLELADVVLPTLTMNAPAADATTSSAPASGTAGAAPELAPAPRGQDGQFGKVPPGGVQAEEPGPAPEGPAGEKPPAEEPAVDDPGGEEKP